MHHKKIISEGRALITINTISKSARWSVTVCHDSAEPVLILPAIMFTTFHLEASAAAVSTKLQHYLQSFQKENGESSNIRQMICYSLHTYVQLI